MIPQKSGIDLFGVFCVAKHYLIINKLDQGIPPNKIAATYSWIDLSVVDQTRLLEEARRRIEVTSDPLPLLRTLLRLVGREDHWSAIKVLSLALKVVEAGKKNGILQSMQDRLKKIRAGLSKSNPEEIKRYMRFLADYYVYRAHTEVDIGNLTRAINSYQQALEIYEKGGPSVSDRVGIVRRDLEHLEAIQSQNQNLVPLEKLEIKHLRLQRKMEEYESKSARAREFIQALEHKLNELQQERDKLRKEVAIYQHQKEQIDRLKEQVNQYTAGLYFLEALPRLAMAPLWVEVVRLALGQGEIDAFTKEALDRLTPHFSEDALPLLAEIAARAPDSLNIDVESYQQRTGHWMAKMAEAKRVREEKGVREAAEILVEAWDTYLGKREG